MSAYLDWYESNARQQMEWYGGILRGLLDSASEQVVWGTWRLSGHMDDDVMASFMEFTEGVLEFIPEKYHAPYKHENVQVLFGLQD